MELFNKVLYLFCIVCCIDAYKVLVSFPFPVRSLNILGEGVVRHFLNAGHEVTYITAYPFKNPPKKNFRQIDASSTRQLFANDPNLNTGHVMGNQIASAIYYVQEIALKGAEAAFADQNVRQLLEDTSETFDVVIADFLETELYAGLSAVYNCPMVWLYSMGAHSVALRLVDQPANPSYAADYLTGHTPPLSFAERVEQLSAHIQWYFLKWAYVMPQEEAIYAKTFGPLLARRGRPLPAYQELVYNASLMLSNEHHALGHVPPTPLNFKFVGGFHIESPVKPLPEALGNVPSTPLNFKFVGGFHIESPVKPLPEDLQTIMDEARHGVIYFSMGSTWQSKDIPVSVKQGLLKMFGELKQTVIWKHEEPLKETPPNVHIVDWAPQHSILAHPKLLFFITHGGLLSSTEALHFGVPIIGVPVFFDQFINVNKAVAKGYALMAKLDHDMPDNLRPVIQEMLKNPKYKQKVTELSAIYHDRPVPPGVELVHWVEHVIRTGGAPHLRSPALHVPLYQKYYMDLAGLVAVLLAAVAKIVTLVFGNKVQKKKRN